MQQFIHIKENMSTEKKGDDTHYERISPRDILMEEEKLMIQYQWEWLMLEDSRKKAFNTLKIKYSQYDN